MAEYLVVDDDGFLVVDAGGKVFATVGGECPDIPNCCDKCFEAWFSEWECGSGWSEPAVLGTFCLPADMTTGAWVDVYPWGSGLRTGAVCMRFWYRACEDPTTCIQGESCAACDGTTAAPPDPPTEDVSGQCCDEPCPCPAPTDCGCGPRAGSNWTPSALRIAFIEVKNSIKCTYVTDSPFEAWRMDASALEGQSYTVNFTDDCSAVISLPVKIMQCHWSGEGDADANNCQPCEDGETDVTVSATLTVNPTAIAGTFEIVWSYRGGTQSTSYEFGHGKCCSPNVERIAPADWYQFGATIITTPCAVGGGGEAPEIAMGDGLLGLEE